MPYTFIDRRRMLGDAYAPLNLPCCALKEEVVG